MGVLRKAISAFIISLVLISFGYYGGKRVLLHGGKILVTQTFLDSLAAVRDTITIEVDTIPPTHDTIIITKNVPIPQLTKDSTYCYVDSLKTVEVLVTLRDTVSTKGIILSRQWEYTLFVPSTIINTVHEVKTVPVPYKVIEKTSSKYMLVVGYDIVQKSPSLEFAYLRSQFLVGGEVSKNSLQLKVGYTW